MTWRARLIRLYGECEVAFLAVPRAAGGKSAARALETRAGAYTRSLLSST